MAVKRSFREMLPPAPQDNSAPVTASEPAGATSSADTAAPTETDPPVVSELEASAPAQDIEDPAAVPAAVPTAVESVPGHESVTGTPKAPMMDSVPPAPAEDAAAQTAAPAASDDAASARPHYSQLVRKELRVFQDQAVDLKLLTMSINASRVGPGERITDNTLVRVAIDLLLQHRDELSGTSEADLRSSLNLAPRY